MGIAAAARSAGHPWHPQVGNRIVNPPTISMKNPTKTEVALTVSATIAAINLRKLQHEFDRIAAQHDIVPDPNMSLAIESCIESVQAAITLNPTLSAISLDIATRVNNT